MKIRKYSETLNEGLRTNTKYLLLPMGQHIKTEDLLDELRQTIVEIESWE